MPMQADGRGGFEAQAEKRIIAQASFFLYYSHALCALQYYPIYIHKVYWQPRRDRLQDLKATQRMDQTEDHLKNLCLLKFNVNCVSTL
jgi:hypothetical protein